jgi:hypothetical protein
MDEKSATRLVAIVVVLASVGTYLLGMGAVTARMTAIAILISTVVLLARLFGTRFSLHLCILILPLTILINLVLYVTAHSVRGQ